MYELYNFTCNFSRDNKPCFGYKKRYYNDSLLVIHYRMYYLQVKELAYRYHTRQIIDGVDFSIQKGQKIALIARNGMGKTTLLNIISGKLECTHGEVARNKACRV